LEAVKKAISDDGTMIVSNADVMQFNGSTPMEMSIKSLIDTEIGVIAGVFGLSPHLIGGSGDQKYNNVRQKQTAMYKDTLQPIKQLPWHNKVKIILALKSREVLQPFGLFNKSMILLCFSAVFWLESKTYHGNCATNPWIILTHVLTVGSFIAF
jgi:hypothetical protein